MVFLSLLLFSSLVASSILVFLFLFHKHTPQTTTKEPQPRKKSRIARKSAAASSSSLLTSKASGLASGLASSTGSSVSSDDFIEDEDDTAKLAKREKIFKELVETEELYIQHLKMTIFVYKEPMESSSCLSEEDATTIFGNIATLIPIHERLLAGLNECVDGKKTLGNALIELMPFMKLYIIYVNNYTKSSHYLDELLQRDSFTTFFKDWKDDGPSELRSLLIRPVQRVPRYQLLLREIIRSTPIDHPDLSELQKAESTVVEVAAFINECKRRAENDYLQAEVAARSKICSRVLIESVDETEALPHSFVSVTFKSPHWCDVCKEFLWGLVKQGLRCKVCRYSVHRKCKDRAPNNCISEEDASLFSFRHLIHHEDVDVYQGAAKQASLRDLHNETASSIRNQAAEGHKVFIFSDALGIAIVPHILVQKLKDVTFLFIGLIKWKDVVFHDIDNTSFIVSERFGTGSFRIKTKTPEAKVALVERITELTKAPQKGSTK